MATMKPDRWQNLPPRLFTRMGHVHIIGFGWLLVGILGWYVYLPTITDDMAGPGRIRISWVITNGLFIRLVFSTAGIFAGYGFLHHQHWAKLVCQILSNLLLLDSLLGLFLFFSFYTSQGIEPGTGWVAARSVIRTEVLFLFSAYSLVVLTVYGNSDITTASHPAAPELRRLWPSFISLCAGNISGFGFLGLLSWFSLAAPFIAYGLCAQAFSHPWSHLGTWASVVLTRRYTFLASSIIGVFVLFADVGFKQWRLIWKPLAGLALTYLHYVWAARFIMFKCLND